MEAIDRLQFGDIPRVPSIALGSGEVTLQQLTAAYATFANGGQLPQPFLIRRVEDREGELLYEATPQLTPAFSPTTSFLMASMLTDVINAGTAYKARADGFTLPAAGKTGTTNDYVDAWFVGFTPSLVAGVWVGFDQPQTIVRGGYGGDLAVPVWADFMKTATKGDKPVWLKPPPNVVVRAASAGCRGAGRPELRRSRGRVEDRRDEGPLDDHDRALRARHRAVRRVPAPLGPWPADAPRRPVRRRIGRRRPVSDRPRRCPSGASTLPPARGGRRPRPIDARKAETERRAEEEARLLGPHLRIEEEGARRRPPRIAPTTSVPIATATSRADAVPFRDLKGHRAQQTLLARALMRDALPQSLIFAGPDGVGKRLVALSVAQRLNCLTAAPDEGDACGTCSACRRIAGGTHPDVVTIQGVSMLGREEGRRGPRADRPPPIGPFEGRRRVFIIDDADALQPVVAERAPEDARGADSLVAVHPGHGAARRPAPDRCARAVRSSASAASTSTTSRRC